MLWRRGCGGSVMVTRSSVASCAEESRLGSPERARRVLPLPRSRRSSPGNSSRTPGASRTCKGSCRGGRTSCWSVSASRATRAPGACSAPPAPTSTTGFIPRQSGSQAWGTRSRTSAASAKSMPAPSRRALTPRKRGLSSSSTTTGLYHHQGLCRPTTPAIYASATPTSESTSRCCTAGLTQA